MLNIHQFNVYLSKTVHNVFPRWRGDVSGEPRAGGKKEEERASNCENGQFKSDLVNEIVFRSQAEADATVQHAAVTYKSAFLRRSFAMQNWANWGSC